MNNPILNHRQGLTKYRASQYFACLPTLPAETGSLTLCTVHFLSLPSDPTVTSDALAIRIVFPLVRVTPEYLRLGLPAMPGKQKDQAPCGTWSNEFEMVLFQIIVVGRTPTFKIIIIVTVLRWTWCIAPAVARFNNTNSS